MANVNVNCIEDLTGVLAAMEEGKSGVLAFVGNRAVLTTVADDVNAVIGFVNGVATVVTPIVNGDIVIAAGDTIATQLGVITAHTPA